YSAGLLMYRKYFDVGFALHHITQPDESFTSEESKLPYKFVAHASANVPLDARKKFFFSPGFRFWKQDDFKELEGSMTAKLHFVLVNFAWRESDKSYSAGIGFVTRCFRVSYVYDETVSKLSDVAAGSH